MADFSLTTLFVVPSTQAGLPAALSTTQDLGAGVFGFFKNDYTADTAAATGAAPYFYAAQGRENTYLQASKRSDKIKGCSATANCNSNVTEYYKVNGCGTASNQVTEISGWTVQCGDVITITLRAHSSYLDTLYFNGWTRSVTVQAPCCECDDTGCEPIADLSALIDKLIAKLREQAPGNNPDNISLNQFYTFENVGGAILRITGKPLTKYGLRCDIAAFPHEYDRMWFRTFVYEGPATTADFIVADACNFLATANVTQRATYPIGTAAEILQLEKNYYSYQAGYLKHLYRMMGYNQNYQPSLVEAGAVYNTYYIKFNEYDRSAYQWGDFIPTDSMIIIAAVVGSTIDGEISTFLNTALGPIAAVTLNTTCAPTTTSTSTTAGLTTTTTSTLFP